MFQIKILVYYTQKLTNFFQKKIVFDCITENKNDLAFFIKTVIQNFSLETKNHYNYKKTKVKMNSTYNFICDSGLDNNNKLFPTFNLEQ